MNVRRADHHKRNIEWESAVPKQAGDVVQVNRYIISTPAVNQLPVCFTHKEHIMPEVSFHFRHTEGVITQKHRMCQPDVSQFLVPASECLQ